MAIDPNAVGVKGEPRSRSWTSKDALLYAVGVGAGTEELPFTTENTKDTPQKVLPTFAVIIGGGGIPMDKVGSFNPALMVHGEQGIELMGRENVEAHHFEERIAGVINNVYVNALGEVLLEELPGGIVAVRKPETEAVAPVKGGTAPDFEGADWLQRLFKK